MEHIQNRIHVAIFISVFVIFIYLLTVSQNNKFVRNKLEESSFIPIYFNGILNTRYKIWNDNRIIICSEDILLPELFEIAFGKGKNFEAQDKFIKETFSTLHNKINVLNETWKLYSIIENPLDRFASTFINNCIKKNNKLEENMCYGCMNSPTCVINYLYKNFKKLTILKNHFYNPNEIDKIFMPYYWRCNMHKDYNLFQMFNYTNFTMFNIQLENLFQKKNIEQEKITLLKKKIKEVYANKNNVNKYSQLKSDVIKSIFNDRNALLQFLNIYYTDYQYFNILVPQF
uniref:Uncharacterized protein n=1 Tax=Strongyloides stercoralis TaxID=6248 RepID=A0A0K0ED73_STRER